MLEQIILRIKEVVRKIAPITNPALLVKVPLDISPAHIPLLSESLLQTSVDGIIVGGYLGLGPESRKLMHRYIQGD